MSLYAMGWCSVISLSCKCKDGYTDIIGDGRFCDNINECAVNSHKCHSHASCSDRADGLSGYECTCTAGYIGDGFECEDENECNLNMHDCDLNAEVS